MFDGVAAAVGDVAEAEAEAVECDVKSECAVDEEFGVVDGVLLVEFREELFRQCLNSCRKEPDMEKFTLIGSQPRPARTTGRCGESWFIDRNVIRMLPPQ